jgi:hypothetical protein
MCVLTGRDRDGLVALARPLIDDILENAAQNNYVSSATLFGLTR